jgi:hypothetical protein
LDPQNYLKTRTLGLAPVNTTLTIKYRFGGGKKSNCGAGQLTTVVDKTFEVSDTSVDAQTAADVANSFSVENPKPIVGGRDEFTTDEIKALISANFAAQNRCVTNEDFIVRAMSMPTRFGSVFRVNAQVNPLNRNAVELVVLAKDANGYIISAPSTLKENLKNYLSRYRMLTQGIEILDGKVINLGLNFSIMSDPDFNKTEVLSNCIDVLKEYFDSEKWQIGQPINLTELTKLLADISGVMSVYNITFVNKIGTIDGRTYSSYMYNINENTRNGIIYCDNNAIFEIKYPNVDIVGTSK